MVEGFRGTTAPVVGQDNNELLTNSPVAHLFVDKSDNTITYANVAAAELFGYSREELVGSSLSKLWPQVQPNGELTFLASNQLISRMDQTGACDFGWWHCKLDGEIFRANIRVCSTSVNGVEGFLFALTDDTEQRREISGIGLADKLLDQATEPFYICELSESFSIRYLNKAARSHYGLIGASLEGRSILEFDVNEELINPVELVETIRSEKKLSFETVHITSSGSELPVKVHASYFADNEGKELVYGSFIDISDKKNVERLYQESLSLSEDLLEEQQKLKASLNELEATHRKNKLLYGVIAHELRTPATVIEMMTHHDQDEWIEDKKAIKSVVMDLLHSIDDMKMLVNPDLERNIHVETITVNDLNTAISSMVGSTVAAAGVDYQQMTLLPDTLESEDLSTDSYRIKAAITNLVRNACLHSDGSRVLCFSGLAKDENGTEYIQWTVSDNGKGIPEEKAAELFAPFKRGDSKSEGTGLGLHIAKTWIEDLGGSISYRRLTPGSEFSVLVPIEFQSDGPAATAAEQSIKEAKAVASRLRILLVEDDKVLQMVTSKRLQKFFAHVDLASDGHEGISKAEADYDIIFTDYFMPNMTGVEMTKRLRDQGYSKPIVGITAATIAGQGQEMLEAGCDEVLFKPANADMILSVVSHLSDDGRFDGAANIGGGE